MPASTKRLAVRLAAFVLAPLFFLAAPAAGQQAELESTDRTAVTAVAPTSSSIVPGPTAAGAAFTFQPGQAEMLQPQPASTLDDAIQGSHSTNVTMMIVGGAVMVVGAVIGGDAGTIVMIGGGVVGIIGLWRYLQ